MTYIQTNKEIVSGPRARQSTLPLSLAPLTESRPVYNRRKQYSQDKILLLLKRGTKKHTSIHHHHSEVQKSVFESFRNHPTLQEHYAHS
jgi:hypothetical protein